MLYHVFTKTIGLLARLYFRTFARNLKVVPKKGAAIIASNHLAVVDSFVLPVIVWRKIWFIGKKEYFQTDTLKHRIIRWFFLSVSVYPVDRAGGQAAEEALNVGRRALDSGNLFGIYPEGTRSPDGHLYKGRTGVAKLALEKRVPVIPVGMIGTGEAQPVGSKFPKPKKCGGIFGEPLDFSGFYEEFDAATKASDARKVHEIIRTVTDQIMAALQVLSGQTYIDMYATEAKKILARGEDVLEYARCSEIPMRSASPSKSSVDVNLC
jgi:1-acyl-sn-glycerol-3-phosphate acyltransferase